MTIGHIISVQRMSTLTVDSFPSRRLWQSTKTGRRWGRWADVVFTDTRPTGASGAIAGDR